MKRIVPLLAVVLTGCVIHSIEPFYSPKSQTSLKEVLGQWQLLQSYGEPVSSNTVRPWVIEPATDNHYKLTAYDPKNIGATFELTFFKVGTTLFVDFVVDQTGEETRLNEYWAAAVHPVHGVCKVLLETNQLQLITLDYKWVTDGLAKKKLTLPYYGTTNDFLLFNATPTTWETFLQKHANDADAFPKERAFVLKRIAETKTP